MAKDDSTDREICLKCLAYMKAIDRRQDEVGTALTQLVDVIDKRVGELIGLVAGKQQVPLDVVKWLVAFMLVFTFSIVFGVGELKNIVHIFGS